VACLPPCGILLLAILSAAFRVRHWGVSLLSASNAVVRDRGLSGACGRALEWGDVAESPSLLASWKGVCDAGAGAQMVPGIECLTLLMALLATTLSTHHNSPAIPGRTAPLPFCGCGCV